MEILDICKKHGMSNPGDIRHWMQEIDEVMNSDTKTIIISILLIFLTKGHINKEEYDKYKLELTGHL